MILPTFESRQLNVNTNVLNHECVGVTVFFFKKKKTLIRFASGSWQKAVQNGKGQAWAQDHQGDGQKAPVNEFV